MMKRLLGVSVLCCILAVVVSTETDPPKKMNVLYIACDDFRPQIGGYGITDPAHVPTPNLDKLISKSTMFRRAYVQQAVCGPSRNSFPISRRPKTSKVWNFRTDFRKTNSSWLTSPQYFKERLSYMVNGNGKFFHPGHPPQDDEPYSWTQPKDGGWKYQDPNHQITYCDEGSHKPFSCIMPENKTVDFVLSNVTQARLQELKARGSSQPFFQVVGHLKPHPFWALDQAAWDAVPLDKVPPPAVGTYVSNMKDDPEPSFLACHSVNLRSNMTEAGLKVMPYTKLPAQETAYIRQGYFAGVVHLDRMIGKTLDTLEELGLADETIVLLHSDHGWELGERGSYCKQSTDELRTRVPFIIYDPSKPQSHGKVIEEPTEILNVFPTLVELATGTPIDYDVEGVSLASVLENPEGGVPPPKGFDEALAFSVFPRCLNVSSTNYNDSTGALVSDNPCTQVPSHEFTHMGLAVRDLYFRYVEWREWDGEKPRFDIPATQIELFDHRDDKGTSFDHNYEYMNDHGKSEFAKEEERLAGYVKQMWGEA